MIDHIERKSGRHSTPEAFEQAATERSGGFLSEFWSFARHHKRWWLAPIMVILLIVAALVLLGGTGAGPLIYPLF
jgi:drug/metabolite transporter superfamily protein YnfA